MVIPAVWPLQVKAAWHTADGWSHLPVTDAWSTKASGDLQCDQSLALTSVGVNYQVSCGLSFSAAHSCIWKIVPYLASSRLYGIQHRRHFRALSSLPNRSLRKWRHLYHKIRKQLSNDWPLPPESWSLWAQVARRLRKGWRSSVQAPQDAQPAQ